MGSIRVSADGRTFVDGDGRPFFWLGDTQWELFRAFSLAEAEAILRNRADKGFSTIQVMLTGVGDGTRPNRAGHTPWREGDPASPDEAYFRHVDAVLDLAGQHGLVLVLGVYHQVQASRFTLEVARRYARWIARRYRDVPHIVWSMYPRAEPGYVPVCRALAAGLQEGDGGAHLITVHPDPSPTSSSFLQSDASSPEPWLAFHSIQTWKYVDLIYPMVREDYALQPARPVVMAEGAYEGGTEYGFEVTPLWVRRQAYHSVLAGGHHSYGHNDSWRVLPTWREALDAPGAFHMGILRRVLEAQDEWWSAIPDPDLFADRQGEGALRSVAVRSAQGDWALAYLSCATAVTVQMDRIAAGATVGAAWIDPTTGRRTPIGRWSGPGIRSFAPPVNGQDALLILEAVAS